MHHWKENDISDENDNYKDTHKDKDKDKEKWKTKTNTKCSKDPSNAIFSTTKKQ